MSLLSICEGNAAAQFTDLSRQRKSKPLKYIEQELHLCLGYQWEAGRGACPSNWEYCWLWNPGRCFCLRSCTLHLQSVFWSVISPFRAAKWQLTVVHSEMCSENNRIMKSAGSNLGGKEKGRHRGRSTNGVRILQTEKGYACVYVLRGRGISTINNTRHGIG